MSTHVVVQGQDFDVGEEYQSLVFNNREDGGIALFVGRVREFNQGNKVSDLTLEHYPGMTQKALEEIASRARARWPVNRIHIIHRVGKLTLTDQIVLVGVTSPHREAAHSAAQFIMDYLKTQAPFWKKEASVSGEQRWVEAQQKDYEAASRW